MRIVLNPFGSFGDLHPFLAIALELKRRGHSMVIATSEVYRTKIEAESLSFAPVRPDVGELLGKTEMLERLWDPRHGTEYLLRDVVVPPVADSFQDLAAASRGADLLVTHTASPAGPIVAEAMRLKWVSVVLQPAAFLSSYDAPVLAPAPWLKSLERLGRWPFRAALALARKRAAQWMGPIFELRTKQHLPRGRTPMIDAQFSPDGTLALFSQHFARPQPDWPAKVTTTGFVYYDKQGERIPGVDQKSHLGVNEFLDSGTPPIVFTLGSSAVMQAGSFYRESLKAALMLKHRAVLLTGPDSAKEIGQNLPASIFGAEYVPYSELLPRAAAIVHQGGIGTTAQALRAGRPMLVVPWAHDQPDNAYRLRKLGVSRTLRRKNYTAAKAAKEIATLLNRPAYAEAARRMRELLFQEDGLKAACDVLENA